MRRQMDALYRFSREPRWRLRSQLWRYSVPPILRDWLLDSSSLTQRLRAHCGGKFSVRVLDQGYRAPSAEERRTLGLRPGSWALIRQVYLSCDGTPWVFARTVVPVKSLKGRGRALARLGARPLGELLFADPHLSRGEPAVAALEGYMPLHATATGGVPEAGAIWGRRSCFVLERKRLLVSEFFLTDFVTAMEARDDADK